VEEEAKVVAPQESEGPRRFKHAEYPEEETIPFFPNYILLLSLIHI
jgi:hypothetical protein